MGNQRFQSPFPIFSMLFNLLLLNELLLTTVSIPNSYFSLTALLFQKLFRKNITVSRTFWVGEASEQTRSPESESKSEGEDQN